MSKDRQETVLPEVHLGMMDRKKLSIYIGLFVYYALFYLYGYITQKVGVVFGIFLILLGIYIGSGLMAFSSKTLGETVRHCLLLIFLFLPKVGFMPYVISLILSGFDVFLIWGYIPSLIVYTGGLSFFLIPVIPFVMIGGLCRKSPKKAKDLFMGLFLPVFGIFAIWFANLLHIILYLFTFISFLTLFVTLVIIFFKDRKWISIGMLLFIPTSLILFLVFNFVKEFIL